MKTGDWVQHPRYGPGQVETARNAGFELRVRFESQLCLWCRADHLSKGEERMVSHRQTQVLDETEALLDRIMGKRRKAPSAPSILSLDDAELNTSNRLSRDPKLRTTRLALEAFRLGIVPEQSIRDWTVGRDDELKEISNWLHDPASGSLVIEGAYGSGKSHTLAVLRLDALDANWAVASVGIDPTDAPAGFPKRVYRHAIANIRVPWDGEVLGLEQVLELLCSMDPEPIASHSIWSQVYQIWNKWPTKRRALLAYLRGRPIQRRLMGLPNLPDHTTAANVYCYLLSGLSRWVAESLQLEGMLLLIDEAEMSRTYRYTYEWSRGVNFFNGLAWVADDDDVLESEVIERLDCFRGERSGLVYSGFLKVPYIYEIPCRFKVVFAFTPGYTRFFNRVRTENRVSLDLPRRKELMRLFDRLCVAYRNLYSLEMSSQQLRQNADAIIDRYGDSIRYLIKGFVELLDHRRFYPDSHPETLFLHAGSAF
jgi:hypothetical protein